VAVFETSCGTIEIELDTARAPRTTASFAHLVEEGVYDGTGFHRVAPGFVIQGGDPSGDGSGGPGYFVDEPPPSNLAYTEGTVAMAKTAAEPPGRSGSQFYVVTGADAGLPPEYALVGEVVGGEDVVAAIEDLGPPGGDGPPSKPVVIERATLEEA
jgi:cyclophilin family peptidyl-prolyl cis-trans isomerase